ncbi:MAG: MetS family NSS transporter small subunit [Rubrobacteraceae bacterium]
MNVGAIIMLLLGSIGLWGGLIVAIIHFFRAAKKEAEAGGPDSE